MIEPDSQQQRDLRTIVRDGAAFSLMVGIGETYIPAFGLAIGSGEVTSGLLTTLPLLMGAVLQLVSPTAIRLLRSHRRWVSLCAAIQASVFLPMAWGAWRGDLPVPMLYCLAALYWAGGLGAAPAWNTWVGRIVPPDLRARYFADRTRLCQLCLLFGFVVGGATLQIGSYWHWLPTTFALLFVVAAACRFQSARWLASQSEPAGLFKLNQRVPWRELLGRARNHGDGRVLVYMLAVQAAVQISGPFFTPFMLKQLRFSYVEFVSLVSCAYFAKILAMPLLGWIAQRYGARRLLWVGGIGIIPVASLWLVSNRFWYLAGVQALGGTFWGAYELAMALLFFESIREEERTSVLTAYNLFHALATLSGSLVGGSLLALLGAHHGAYLTVFAVSSSVRALSAVLLFRAARPAKPSVIPAPHIRLANWSTSAEAAALEDSAVGAGPENEIAVVRLSNISLDATQAAAEQARPFAA